jgi:hypothetical protein
MQPAMHVGVLRGVGQIQPIEHGLRLLRRGGVVEIDERLAVNLGGEDGEIRADAVHVVSAVGHRFMHIHAKAIFFLRMILSENRFPLFGIMRVP